MTKIGGKKIGQHFIRRDAGDSPALRFVYSQKWSAWNSYPSQFQTLFISRLYTHIRFICIFFRNTKKMTGELMKDTCEEREPFCQCLRFEETAEADKQTFVWFIYSGCVFSKNFWGGFFSGSRSVSSINRDLLWRVW